MLEKGKTYKWEDFWKYCKIGETYKVDISGVVNGMEILKSNEIYTDVERDNSIILYNITDFISTFIRFLGPIGNNILHKNNWYDICPIYDFIFTPKFNEVEFYLSKDNLNIIMDSHGETNIENFIENFVKKLPHYTHHDFIGPQNALQIYFEFEQANYLENGEHILTIKNKKDIWKIKVDDKGEMAGDDPHFWNLLDDVNITINEIS